MQKGSTFWMSKMLPFKIATNKLCCLMLPKAIHYDHQYDACFFNCSSRAQNAFISHLSLVRTWQGIGCNSIHLNKGIITICL